MRKCLGRIVLAGQTIQSMDAHNHPPEHAEVRAELVCKSIRKRAIDTHETTLTIVQRQIENLNDEVALKLPKLPNQ